MSKAHEVIAQSGSTAPATESEDAAIREQYDTVLIATGGAGVSKHLHLPVSFEDDIPRCRKAGGVPTRWHSKPIGVYPPGFKPYCTECLAVWRDLG